MSDSDIPPRRDGTPEELEELIIVRSDIHYDAVEVRLARFVNKSLIAFAVIGVTCAISILGFGFVLKQQHDTSNDIQRQRFEALVYACNQQNDRHDRTIEKANKLLPAQGRLLVILLVNELQPYVPDCVAMAKTKVKG